MQTRVAFTLPAHIEAKLRGLGIPLSTAARYAVLAHFGEGPLRDTATSVDLPADVRADLSTLDGSE
jgi:hypothetical protein